MLKLGTQTGSLINHVYSRANSAEPVVGMGVTFLNWTDRAPGTIVEVRTRKDGTLEIDVTPDEYRRTDKNGLSESQEYEYTSRPEGVRQTFRRIDGNWVHFRLNPETGRWNKLPDTRIVVGRREAYRDPSF